MVGHASGWAADARRGCGCVSSGQAVVKFSSGQIACWTTGRGVKPWARLAWRGGRASLPPLNPSPQYAHTRTHTHTHTPYLRGQTVNKFNRGKIQRWSNYSGQIKQWSNQAHLISDCSRNLSDDPPPSLLRERERENEREISCNTVIEGREGERATWPGRAGARLAMDPPRSLLRERGRKNES